MEIVLTSLKDYVFERAISCKFKTTNNEIEYEALIAGITLARDLGAKHFQINNDSQLIVNQVGGDFQTKDTRMTAYLLLVRELTKCFEGHEVRHVPRDENRHVDALANLGSAMNKAATRMILMVIARWPAIRKEISEELEVLGEVNPVEENRDSCMISIIRMNGWETN